MGSDDKPEKKHHDGHFVFVPAGILIGLGIGMLANQPGSGVLIGLGFGLIVASFMASNDAAAAGSAPQCRCAGVNWVTVVIGVFLILIGIGFVWTLPFVWPYLIAIILILLGISFAIRGLRHQ